MKKHIIILSAFCLSLVLLFVVLTDIITGRNFDFVFSQNQFDYGYTVIVDAGHGGEDGGAVAPDGTLEKGLNLDIALKLEQILKLYGFNVIMTRTTDVMTCDDNLKTQREKKVSDIHNRMKIINENKNAIFVSIHQNNFSDKTQNGTQVFYSKNNLQSKILADSIQESVVKSLQKNNNRITKKSGTEIYLLYHSQIPSVLVECGFLSNYNDLANLKNEDYRIKMSMLIADGIINYTLKR